jgi:integrase
MASPPDERLCRPFGVPDGGSKQRDKDSVRKRTASVVKQTNTRRAERDLPGLPTVSPHALRRTYISLLIEAGAPLP